MQSRGGAEQEHQLSHAAGSLLSLGCACDSKCLHVYCVVACKQHQQRSSGNGSSWVG
jgi:hypothetical protein